MQKDHVYITRYISYLDDGAKIIFYRRLVNDRKIFGIRLKGTQSQQYIIFKNLAEFGWVRGYSFRYNECDLTQTGMAWLENHLNERLK